MKWSRNTIHKARCVIFEMQEHKLWFKSGGFRIDKENTDGSVDYCCDVADYEPHRTFIDVSLAERTLVSGEA